MTGRKPEGPREIGGIQGERFDEIAKLNFRGDLKEVLEHARGSAQR